LGRKQWIIFSDGLDLHLPRGIFLTFNAQNMSYIASTSLSRRSQFYLQTTLQCIPAFNLCMRSPDGATTDCSGRHLAAAYYSFVDPKRMKG